VSHPTAMTRNFSQLQQQIESTLAKLKAAKDPSLRLDALREMRRLLIEQARDRRLPFPRSLLGLTPSSAKHTPAFFAHLPLGA
jgi:hypothetical protein